jgi:hypothetical protein
VAWARGIVDNGKLVANLALQGRWVGARSQRWRWRWRWLRFGDKRGRVVDVPGPPLVANTAHLDHAQIVAEDVLCQPPSRSEADDGLSGGGEVRSPETGSGHPLGCSVVDHCACVAGDGDDEMALQRAVQGRVVGGVVAPALSHDSVPGTTNGTDRAGVLMAALSCLGVERLCPRVPVAA